MPLSSSVVDISHGHRGGRVASARESKGAKRGGRHATHHHPKTEGHVTTAGPPMRAFATPPPRSSTRGRKGVDATFLLNFHAPERPAPVAPPPKPYRRRTPLVHFNKDRFMHANFRFVVCPGDYSAYASDADRMVEWDSIRQVHVSHEAEYNCPICLEPPSVSRVTKCGHVFCWPCLLRLFESCSKPYAPCPICTDIVTDNTCSLKPAVVERVVPASNGAMLTFDLVRLSKGRVAPLRVRSALEKESSAASSAADNHEGEKSAGHGGRSNDDADADADDDDALRHGVGACPVSTRVGTADCQGVFDDGGGCLLSLHPDAPFSKITVAQDESAISERERSELTEMLETAISCGEQESVEIIQRCLRKLDTEEAANASATAMAAEQGKQRQEQHQQAGSSTAKGALGGGGGGFYERPVEKSGSGRGKLRWWEGGQMCEEGLSDENDCDVVSEEEGGHVSETSSEEEGMGHAVCGEDVYGLEEGEDPSDVDEDDDGDGDCDGEAGAATSGTSRRYFSQGEPGTYVFYQSSDGQTTFLDSLTMKCLLEQHGGYTSLPSSISARVVHVSKYVQTEETRRRYKQLEHLPLTCEVVQAQADVAPLVDSRVMRLFKGELEKREDARRRKEAREEAQRVRAEREERRRTGRGTPPPPPSDLFEGPELSASLGGSRGGGTLDRSLEQAAEAAPGGVGKLASPSWSFAASVSSPSTVNNAPRWGAMPRLSLGEEDVFPSLGDAATTTATTATAAASPYKAQSSSQAGSWGARTAAAPGSEWGSEPVAAGGEDAAWDAAFAAAAERAAAAAGGGGGGSGGKRRGRAKGVVLSW